MSALCAIAACLLAAAADEIVVQDGETLAQVAKRALGDEKAAKELRALNALPSDEVKGGTHLKLPGPDRAIASSAISSAKHAIGQPGHDDKNRTEAAARLADAEALFGGARYAEAAKTADAAWKLVSADAGEPTRFAVQVAGDGKTLVSARSGNGVRVDAQGVTQAVYAGQSASIERGQAPQMEGTGSEPPPLVSPGLVSPPDSSQFRFKPTGKGLGPLRVSWTAVAGASAYEVEVMPAIGPARPLVLPAAKTEAKLPPMTAGKYRWSVRAVGNGGVKSPPSGERSFELVDEDLKLDVKTNTWK